MKQFTTIIILYNPHSTGSGEANAKSFARQLRRALPDTPVRVRPTNYAGHAEEIAKQYGDKRESIFLISSSGDGGYHEVINGALESGSTKLVTGLLPSGNANDHYHALHENDILDDIAKHQIRTIDVLRVDATMNGRPWHRYAHSYAGIGLAPQIGKKLTEAKLNPFNEVALVIKHLFRFHPVKIKTNNHVHRYDSLTFSNIDRMSKHMSLADDASVTDGKFEVTGVKTQSFRTLFGFLLKASTVGLNDSPHHTEYRFQCVRATAMQLDGEVFTFAAGTDVTVSCQPRRLRCII
jgi:diacylglycerol kinase (ATP)